jgi:hypothetical protein
MTFTILPYPPFHLNKNSLTLDIDLFISVCIAII